MSATKPEVVVRRVFKPTSIPSVNQIFDYLTARGSWTNNPGIAQRFANEARAAVALRMSGGKGQVIPEAEIGKAVAT